MHTDYEPLQIHGTQINPPIGECGIYKTNGIVTDYAIMDVSQFIAAINSMTPAEAVSHITAFRELANHQLSAGQPHGFGYPILLGPQPTDFKIAKPGLENTIALIDDVLKALNGQ